MYDGSAYNKTQKKLYYEPIQNVMFDNFVLNYPNQLTNCHPMVLYKYIYYLSTYKKSITINIT